MSKKPATRINIGWSVPLSRKKGPYKNKGRNSLEQDCKT